MRKVVERLAADVMERGDVDLTESFIDSSLKHGQKKWLFCWQD
jgi:hypothetical protein